VRLPPKSLKSDFIQLDHCIKVRAECSRNNSRFQHCLTLPLLSSPNTVLTDVGCNMASRRISVAESSPCRWRLRGVLFSSARGPLQLVSRSAKKVFALKRKLLLSLLPLALPQIFLHSTVRSNPKFMQTRVSVNRAMKPRNSLRHSRRDYGREQRTVFRKRLALTRTSRATMPTSNSIMTPVRRLRGFANRQARGFRLNLETGILSRAVPI
jgi:hypothetical protein